MAFYEERQRAESFGQAASQYDAFRPQYPGALVDTIISSARPRLPRVLDVGSGTGILAAQLREARCDVLGVEPDPQMAALAQNKGLRVEVSTFEDWDPAERTYDIVTFGQSFHWVDPGLGLRRITQVLNPGGTLALAWNDIQASGEIGHALTSILERFTPVPTSSSAQMLDSAEITDEHPVIRELQRGGFDAAELRFEESVHYSRNAWLSMVFTYSAQLTMEFEAREQMFAEMFAAIPDDGLEAHNDAQLILSRPFASTRNLECRETPDPPVFRT